MAIILRTAYKQAADNKSIDAYSLTGIYSGVNQGGYGSPNPSAAAFSDCRIYIFHPSSDTLLPDMTPFDVTTTTAPYITAYPALPTTITTNPFNMNSTEPALYGVSQVIPSGIFRFVRWQEITTDPPLEIYDDVRVPIIGSTLCCIQNLILAADLCGCHDTNYLKLLKAKMFLDQLTVCSRELGNLSPVELCNLWVKGAEIIMAAEAICNSQCAPCAPCG